MGQTAKPLKIIVTDKSLLGEEAIMLLIEQGHVVRYHHMLDAEEVDLIFGVNCHFMRADMLQHTAIAIKGARTKKFPPKPKEAKVATKRNRRA